jgi:glutamine synthetase adenylyltransferase
MAHDLTDWLERGASLEDRFRILRRFRKREMVRIGLLDLTRQGDLVETTEDLSNLADVCLAGAYEVCFQELAARYGRPMQVDETGQSQPCEFAILGLGKLGGQELNFSSDIDLMFLYTCDGETSNGSGSTPPVARPAGRQGRPGAEPAGDLTDRQRPDPPGHRRAGAERDPISARPTPCSRFAPVGRATGR